jgi:hypothetical protein
MYEPETHAPRVRGVKTAWTLGVIVLVLLLAGGVFAYVFTQDLHRWDTTIADKRAQILALTDEHQGQNRVSDQADRDLANTIAATNKAQVAVDCAAKVQVVWTIIKNRQFSTANGPLQDMVRACQTNAGSFTITVR